MSKRSKLNKKISIPNTPNVIDKIKESSFLSKISVVAVINMVYMVINYVYGTLYQIDCEKYYKIPRYYFSASVNYSLLFIGAIVFVVLASFYFPRTLGKKDGEKRTTGNKVELVFFAAMFGLLYGMTNWSILEGIVTVSYLKDNMSGFSRLIIENAWLFFIIVLAISMLAIILWALFDVNRGKENRGYKWLNNVAVFFGMICFIITMLGALCRSFYKAEDKRNYEFITYGSEEYVVLSEYNGNALAVPYEVVVDDEGEKYTFLTNEYRLIPKTDVIMKYKQLIIAPGIE